MRQIIYISTASGPQNNDDMNALLAKSRMNNDAADLTGLLLYNGTRFLQVLEGENDSVQERYERIALDDRHRSIVTLSDREVEAREFGIWSMAFAHPDTRQFASLAAQVEAAVESAGPDTKSLFESFAKAA